MTSWLGICMAVVSVVLGNTNALFSWYCVVPLKTTSVLSLIGCLIRWWNVKGMQNSKSSAFPSVSTQTVCWYVHVPVCVATDGKAMQ